MAGGLAGMPGVVSGRLYRPGGSYHAPALPTVGRDQAGADALGAAGDDGDLLALIAHGAPVGAVVGGYMIAGSLGGGDSGVGSTVLQRPRGSPSTNACIWAAAPPLDPPRARPPL